MFHMEKRSRNTLIIIIIIIIIITDESLRGDTVVETKAALKVVNAGVKRVLLYLKIEKPALYSTASLA